MTDMSKDPFLNYMEKKGVIQREFQEKMFIKNCEIEENIINQLHIISEFHKRSMGYNDYIGHRLEDKRGRTIEQYKVYLKRVNREYKDINQNSPRNDFEKILLQYGEEYLKKAERAIKVIYENGYLEIIKRSMKRNEICLGNTYFNNLRKIKFIETLNLEKCFYDLVEIDAANFLKKLIKKKLKLDYKVLIDKFCEFEKLDNKSNVFLKALISYPSEFMKCCSKYIINSKYMIYDNNLDMDKIKKKLKKAIACEANISI
ncbi:spore coat protein [Clostridium botulinum C]|uniref:Spore coat protein n=3 Tax=Clostridium botulinum TaxID=1491 RepID=A0A9Q4TP48_CLOBO|nr:MULTISPECIES: spore coat protein [Clostridium]NFD88075.1 spore coat protein [Clostridium botulinum]KEI11042.1 spore coat protein [Clostridium sp. K25]MCD3195004.1 spore coat protein [Clostridium botulinum C]MCD3200803.1 spore coat protein [Clostridium botulinum C]MCD3206211.1 spore coat protein [Clostridium botulinum C]